MILGLGFTLVVLLFYKDSKKTFSPGKAVVEKHTAAEGSEFSMNIQKTSTLTEALKTRDFWSYNLAIAFFAMFNTAFTFHIVSIFSYAGIDRASAVTVFIPISIIAVLCQIAGSTLSDYISLKIILISELFGIICSSIAILFLAPGLFVGILILGLGISNGTFVALLNLAWVKTFGKEHLGAISGYAMGWTVGGSAVGPFLFSLLKDLTGDYDLVALISIVFIIFLLIFSFYRKGAARA
jgi:MFS family permease